METTTFEACKKAILDLSNRGIMLRVYDCSEVYSFQQQPSARDPIVATSQRAAHHCAAEAGDKYFEGLMHHGDRLATPQDLLKFVQNGYASLEDAIGLIVEYHELASTRTAEASRSR